MKLNYKQNKIEEFKKKFREGNYPQEVKTDWHFKRIDEAENFLSETIDEIIGCLPEQKKVAKRVENWGFNVCRQDFIDNLNKKYVNKRI